MDKKVLWIVAFALFIGVLVTLTIIYNGGAKNQEVLETEAVDVGIIRINDDSYEEVLKTDNIVVIDFYENMCPPCTSMIPTLINIAKSSDKVTVAMVNVSAKDTGLLANKYEVSATPTIVVLKNRKEIQKFVGATSEEEIMKIINDNMENENEK